MSNPSFPDDPEEIENEIASAQQRLSFIQRNIRITALQLAQNPNNTLFLYEQANRQEDLQECLKLLQDLQAHKTQIAGNQTLHASVTLLYTHLPTSVLEFYKPQRTPLVQFKIVNQTKHPIKFILQSEIEDYSDLCTQGETVPASTEKTFPQLPLLKLDKLKKLRGPTKATIHTHIKEVTHETEYPDRPEDFEIEFMPRNEIRWAVPDATDTTRYIPLLEHIAAWITPHAEAVEQALRIAADYHQLSFDGYAHQSNPELVRNQVKAIFLALKDKIRLAFVPEPFTIGSHDDKVRQIIRLPAETLQHRSGNCIEQTVLYTSLIEAANLQPVIVLTTDHAFVGWKIHTDTDSYEFLETTIASHASFEEVSLRGTKRYQDLVRDQWFSRPAFDPAGFASLLDIKALHDEGIYRQE